MRSVRVVVVALAVTGCASLRSSPAGDQPYIDRRVNGDRVTYRHLSAEIVSDAVTQEAIKFCRERGREAFFVARYTYSANQLLTSFDCRKPASSS